MANKLENLLRKVFLGSLAGIAASNTSTANTDTEVFKPIEEVQKVESLLNRKRDLTPKLLLKKTSTDEWSFLSHRSHRSHQSHQSHRSHYSSYTGGETEKSTPQKNPGLQPNNDNNKSTTAAYKLGSRTLKKEMTGTDVTELVNILLKKGYLKLDDGGTQLTGILTYDEIIEGAVKKFQIDNGLTGDGVCGPTTIYYLKNK